MKEADSSKVEDYKRNLQLRNAGNIFISKYQDSLESDNNVLNIETDDSRHYDTRHAKRTELRSAGNSFVNRYEDVMECDDVDNTNLVEELLDGNESNDPSWRSSNDLLKKYEDKIRNMDFSQFSSSDYSDSEEVE
jgi:ribosomal protein S17E